jgi:hypothetical protein
MAVWLLMGAIGLSWPDGHHVVDRHGLNGVDSANVRAAYANDFKSGDKADIASLRISAITGYGGR